jgi:protein-tyrosine phosphatase
MLLPILDTPNENIAKYFKQAVQFIQDAFNENSTNKVLVHCFAGKSRSTSFILAYLMMDKGLSLKDAVELTRSKRTIAEPNPGFMIQLKAFEKVIFGTLSDIGIVVSRKAT